jgi:hypothetical protein
VQRGSDGSAESHAGADVAGNGRSIEHDVKARCGDDVDGRRRRKGRDCATVAVVRHRRSRLNLLCGWLCSVAILVQACRCGKAEEPVEQAPAPLAGEYELVRRRVPDTELVVALPKGWQLEMPDPGPLPEVPAPGSSLRLQTRMLVSARPGLPAPGMLVAPWLQVLFDPWLPVGTTGVDYLVAQRASNQVAVGTNIRHVDAEPSRRQGRPSYHVRDEWTVKGPDGAERVMSQEAVLILDDATTPDGQVAVHGFTVVITMEKGEFEALQPVVRAILASIVFEEGRSGASGVAGPPAPR